MRCAARLAPRARAAAVRLLSSSKYEKLVTKHAPPKLSPQELEIQRLAKRASEAYSNDDAPEALRRADESVALSIKTFGSDHAVVASQLSNLGVYQRAAGMPKDAVSTLEKAAATYVSSLKNHKLLDVHPSLLQVRHNLGVAYRDLAKASEDPKTKELFRNEAVCLLESVLEKKKLLYEKYLLTHSTNEDVSKTMIELGGAYRDRANSFDPSSSLRKIPLEKAENVTRIALTHQQSSISAANAKNALALVLKARGESEIGSSNDCFGEAQELLEQALEVVSNTKTEVVFLENLADLFRASGREGMERATRLRILQILSSSR